MTWQLILVPFTWAFTYGLLHTIQPCEDKAIFGFHAFGIAKNSLETFKIVGSYALGLFTINNGLGILFSIAGNFIALIPFFENFVLFVSPIVSITLGSILYYKLAKHGKADEHKALPITFKLKKRMLGFYLFGIITGLPPCPFEFAIYLHAFSASVDYLYFGIFQVFWFSVGTIVGLFILTLLIRSFKKFETLRLKKQNLIQKIALIILIGFGTLSLILNIFGLSLFPQPTHI
ncbi:MAG: urease accessory protein UreH domain-containing protein [Promethearchaeota archaeon]